MTHAEGPRKSHYNHPCIIAQTLDVLGDRWTLLILRDLMTGLSRYGDILENCAGMSPNVLSDRLKRLEVEGLVNREYFRALPPRVEYTLTAKGWAVRPILLALLDWGRAYIATIEEESVGTNISTDFVVRSVPTFLFRPERSLDIAATMVIEISGCEGCNTWSFDIRGGVIRPRRQASEGPEVYLKTDTHGFFRFVRGEAVPEECGELTGCCETAAAIQACFLTA